MDEAAEWELVNGEPDGEPDGDSKIYRTRMPLMKYGALLLAIAILVAVLANVDVVVAFGKSARVTAAPVDKDIGLQSTPQFYLAELHKACEIEDGIVTSQQECAEAAQHLSKGTPRSKSFPRQPPGCLYKSGRVWFNVAEGGGNTVPRNVQVFCKRTAGNSDDDDDDDDEGLQPTAQFYLAELDKACEKEDGIVTSQQECADAAQHLSKGTPRSKSFPRQPPGCLYNSDRVWFNVAEGGGNTVPRNFQVFCKRTAGIGDDDDDDDDDDNGDDGNYPQGLLQCPGGAVSKTRCPTESERLDLYNDVVSRVVHLYDDLSPTCNSTFCPQADFAGCIVRFAGHDLMDFNGQTGGSDGCIKFEDPDNKGLQECMLQVRTVYHDICTRVSLADFIVVAAEALIMRSRHDWDGMKSPSLRMDMGFQFGRQTRPQCEDNGPLPNAMQSRGESNCKAVEDNFLDQLGLTWRYGTALMGVHTLGRAELKNSGFDGWWTSPPAAKFFDNTYFHTLVTAGWRGKTLASGKAQWVRSDILRFGRGPKGPQDEMMLDTDMCLLYTFHDNDMKNCNGAADCECCAWNSPFAIKERGITPACQVTDPNAPPGGDGTNRFCCQFGGRDPDADTDGGITGGDCGDQHAPHGKAAEDVLEFASSESGWLTAFKTAWRHTTAFNGQVGLCHGGHGSGSVSAPNASCVVTVYDGPGFTKEMAKFPIRREIYIRKDAIEMGMKDDRVSSVKVQPGCTATLFDAAHGKHGRLGSAVVLTAGEYTRDQLEARRFDDNKASSIQVSAA